MKSIFIAELRHRRIHALLGTCTLGAFLSLAIIVVAMSAGVANATDAVIHPLGSLETGLLVTQSPNAVGPAEGSGPIDPGQDAAVVDLARLGPSGSHFAIDAFQPASAHALPADAAALVAPISGVASVRGALTVKVVHSEGQVPNIVAEFHSAPQTIGLPSPSASDAAQIDRCMSALAPQQRTPGAFFDCLPAHLKSVQTARQVLTQTVALPSTEIIHTIGIVGGVLPSGDRFGLLTDHSIEMGRSPLRGEAVISSIYAATHFLGLGSTLTIRQKDFTIVGISRPPVSGFGCDIYVPLDELQQLLGHIELNYLFVQVTSVLRIHAVTESIKRVLPGATVTSAETATASITGSIKAARDAADHLTVLTVGVILGFGAISSTLIAFTRVRRRSTEIGVLRAIGWSPRRLALQFAAESGVIVFAAALCALGLSTLAAILMSNLPVHLNGHDVTTGQLISVTFIPRIEIGQDLALICVALITGLTGGLLAAWQATRIMPIAVIRSPH